MNRRGHVVEINDLVDGIVCPVKRRKSRKYTAKAIHIIDGKITAAEKGRDLNKNHRYRVHGVRLTAKMTSESKTKKTTAR